MKQPPITCPNPHCGFPGVSIGEREGTIWAACTSCCDQRRDWEDYLTAERENVR